MVDAGRSRLVLVVACVLVAAAVAPGFAGAAPVDENVPAASAGATVATSEGAPTRASAASATPVVQTHVTVSQHPEPGVVSVSIRVTPPDSVSKLEVTVSERLTVAESPGFTRTDDTTWRWREGGVAEPVLRGTYAVNETSETFDGYNYVDTNEWALVNAPDPYVRWWYDYGESPTYRHTVSVDGQGYAGSAVAYLGNYTRFNATRNGQSLTVVVPAVVEDPPNVTRVFDTLGFASRRLDVGGLDDGLNVYIAPDALRSGGRAEFSDAQPDSPQPDDLWVTGSLDPEAATYLHEYAHTRQSFALTDRMDWLLEAQAAYFEALLGLHAGTVDYDSFREMVTSEEYADAVLTDPDHPVSADYEKGARVLAALDAKIRRATDGDRTLEHVWRRLNARDGEVTYEAFARVVERVAGTSMDGWLDRYLTTSAVPAVPENASLFVATEENADADGDGVPSTRELAANTHPFVTDTDDDGLPDGDELGGPTNATAADTDGDGLSDGRERDAGLNATAADTDGDGLTDGWEYEHGSDGTAADTDGDGLSDGRERRLGTSLTSTDTDDDGLTDSAERERGTDPTVADTDGDGLSDGREVERGTDPLDAASPATTTAATAATAATTTAATNGADAGTTAAGSPGFTALAALAALLALSLVALRRR